MSDDKSNKLDKQQREDRETTQRWETERRHRVNDQEPENPQRTREWDQDKKPEKK